MLDSIVGMLFCLHSFFEPLIVASSILFDQCLQKHSRHVCISSLSSPSFSSLSSSCPFSPLRLFCTCVKCNLKATSQVTQQMVESLHYTHFLLLWLLPSLLTGVLVRRFDASGSWPHPEVLSVCPSVSLPCACEPHISKIPGRDCLIQCIYFIHLFINFIFLNHLFLHLNYEY